MGPVVARRVVALLAVALVAAPTFAQRPRQDNSPPHSLFSQSAAETLQRKYGRSELSYLLLDASSGALLSAHWEHPDQPIPMGSLVKPFTALAFAQAHDFRFPTYTCRGKAGGCWQDHPHGDLNLTAAISVSCNAYFLRLAQGVPSERLASIAQSFDLDVPNQDATAANLIGLGDQWKIAPLRMARAYLELVRRKDAPGVAPILEGMRLSALQGTGAAVGRQLQHSAALVKTGTAPCTHSHWAPADGFVLALLPLEQPEILLLVRLHSVTGAKAAESAGRMLRDMEE